MICSENTSLCQNVLFIFISPLSGRLISLGDAASFVRVCLSLCFQPCIKMPGSAGYHGVSSLLSAHSNPADFSTWFFISVFLSICLLFFPLFHSLSDHLDSIPPRKDKPHLHNVIQGPQIFFRFAATVTKRRPLNFCILHLDVIVSLNYKVYQHP